MAGILDPKSRFFDTYITNEGRKQLATGELRMRFVSFSDGLTGYEQSELGVVDSKDGSLFFESMSRPQDSIITENESVVNMMEVRSQDKQPAFLFQDVAGPDGEIIKQPIRASMFGTQIYEPPTGKQITAVSSSGINRKPIEYKGPSKSFYVSGSSTQEVFYNKSSTSPVGWWQFDMFQDQIASVSAAAADDINLSFLFNEKNKASLEIPYSGQPTAGNTLTMTSVDVAGTQLQKQYVFVLVADTKSGGGVLNTGDVLAQGDQVNNTALESGDSKIGGIAVEVHADDADATYQNLKSAINHSNGHNSGVEDKRIKIQHTDNNDNSGVIILSQTYHGSAGNTTISGTVSNATLPEGFSGGANKVSKISQNLISQSGLETNAAYMEVGTRNVSIMTSSVPANISFANQAIRYFTPDIAKSYTGQTTQYIRLNTLPSLYSTIGSGFSNNKFASQISVWFYLNDVNDDYSTIFQLFDRYVRVDNGQASRQEVARLYTNTNTLRISLFSHRDGGNFDTTGTEFTITDRIKPKTWHRVSLAFDHENIFVVLDGNLETSWRKAQPFNYGTPTAKKFHLTSSSDLILGNCFTSNNVLSRNIELNHSRLASSQINGHILECQYFLVPEGGNLPAIPKSSVSAFEDLTSKIATNNFSVTRNNNNLLSNKIGTELIDFYGFNVESNENLRKWINYYPIADEAALYLSGVQGSRPYVTEELMERGVKRVEMTDIIDKVEMVMSGTLFAYQDLKLLGHLDLNVPGEQQGLEIKRQKMKRTQQGESRVVQPGEKISSSSTFSREFKTKLESFPFIDSVFGQLNDYRKEDFIPHLRATEGPSGGKYFEREATVFHLNEIMDNDFDTDDLTYSSSRLHARRINKLFKHFLRDRHGAQRKRRDLLRKTF